MDKGTFLSERGAMKMKRAMLSVAHETIAALNDHDALLSVQGLGPFEKSSPFTSEFPRV